VKRRAKSVLIQVWLPASLLGLWWIVSDDSHSPFWPPLRSILETVRQVWLFDRFESDLLPTLERIAIGFTLAVIIGISLGAILGAIPSLLRVVEPTLEFIRAIPAIALIPISIPLLGIGDGQKIAVIVFVTVWAILLNTIDGVRSIDLVLKDTASAYRFRRRERLFDVYVPGAMPQVFAGMRVALAQAILVAVAAELFAATDGLGHFILLTQAEFRMKEMWSGIVVLGVVAYLANVLFGVIEHRVLRWHRGFRASTLDRAEDGGTTGTGIRQRLFGRPAKKKRAGALA
jgi:ABC-type nitrate/sulfonate/bicarbonate transport system permease component